MCSVIALAFALIIHLIFTFVVHLTSELLYLQSMKTLLGWYRVQACPSMDSPTAMTSVGLAESLRSTAFTSSLKLSAESQSFWVTELQEAIRQFAIRDFITFL